ncbi:phage adaptor protein [Methylobacterium persicinum]|uniref:Uncharacterized protein n=1 Tax=Methylobacterium persicinum TaxID=374426 RepID=A0ABU0HS97_9HYPH|nr:hypothetical protein [Methylobacterium persicinum]MDQ0445219.1 hypothetical protein [Methylobacterium persicinum]GJE37844.1 hypothetical protein KHHGKMAE_1906 [Methylobacterium persicinum]
MTPLDLITQALKKTGVLGVGVTPQAEDVNDAFLDLNMMLAQWNRKRWMVYHLVDVSAPATGATAYRIGPNFEFATSGRITKIESAYFRINPGQRIAPDFSLDFSADFGPQIREAANAVDVPLSVIRSREDYAGLALKGAPGFPAAVYLDADFPVGTLYVWPAPSTGEIHIVVQATLSAFPDLTTDIVLPDEYAEALLYNLAARLRPSYQKAPDPTMTALARASLNTVKVANGQIGTLSMPDTLTTAPARFNIYSGQPY